MMGGGEEGICHVLLSRVEVLERCLKETVKDDPSLAD